MVDAKYGKKVTCVICKQAFVSTVQHKIEGGEDALIQCRTHIIQAHPREWAEAGNKGDAAIMGLYDIQHGRFNLRGEALGE